MFERLLKVVAVPLIIVGSIVIFMALVRMTGALIAVTPDSEIQGGAIILSGILMALQGVLFMAAGGAARLLLHLTVHFERVEERLRTIELTLRDSSAR